MPKKLSAQEEGARRAVAAEIEQILNKHELSDYLIRSPAD